MRRIAFFMALSVMAYAAYNNLWAEPGPPKITPAFTIEMEPAKSAEEIELEVEIMQESKEMYERELIARCVEAEAGNQSTLGKRLVVDVILNRVDDPRFPDTIKDVIYQQGQFAVVENGVIYTVTPSNDTYFAIIQETGRRTEPSIVYFNAGGYPKYGTPYERVGDHYFSK